MNAFWWGVLALPLAVLALAAVVAAVFGSWLLLEKWSAYRWRKLALRNALLDIAKEAE